MAVAFAVVAAVFAVVAAVSTVVAAAFFAEKTAKIGDDALKRLYIFSKPN